VPGSFFAGHNGAIRDSEVNAAGGYSAIDRVYGKRSGLKGLDRKRMARELSDNEENRTIGGAVPARTKDPAPTQMGFEAQ